jgi:hypothetical protein
VSVIVFFFEWKRARCEFSLLNAIYDILKHAMNLQYKEGDDVVNLLMTSTTSHIQAHKILQCRRQTCSSLDVDE